MTDLLFSNCILLVTDEFLEYNNSDDDIKIWGKYAYLITVMYGMALIRKDMSSMPTTRWIPEKLVQNMRMAYLNDKP